MTAIDRLAHTSRWRHRPLAEKALLALGLLVLALVLPPLPGGLLVLAAAISAALAARIPPKAWLAAMAAPLGFVTLGAAATLVSLDGTLTSPAAAVAVLMRGTASVAALLLLAMTTPAADLIQGCRRLGLSAEIAEIALATYRFVFLLDDTARSIHAGQQARLGYDGFGRSVKSLGLLVAALLPRALDRARRLENGLAARGFDGALPTLAPSHPATMTGMGATVLVLAAVAGAGLW
jgi:cobalt/nickel transport system permease protein